MGRPRNIEREEREGRGKSPEPLFYTWASGDARGKAAAMQASGRALDHFEGVVRRARGEFCGPTSCTDDPGVLRRTEGLWGSGPGSLRARGKPLRPRDILFACMLAYDEFGIVRSIIDTMADFTVQGIDLVHPNPRIEKFFKNWFDKVEGPDVSEHIANTLFLAANAPVRRHTARLRAGDRDDLRRGRAAADRPPNAFRLPPGEIPWSYSVLNPVQMVVLGGDLVPFVGPNAFTFAVVVPAAVLQQIKRPRNPLEKDLINKLPPEVRKHIMDGLDVIPLNNDAMRMIYYKRRHWQVWATPMTYPLLDDLMMLRKLKLADLAALDGAISHIRIWKLGSLEQQMMPTARALQKLADMLAHAGSGETMDLIWGPDLELQETSTEIHRFLGDAKYAAHLNAIYAGYGIPPTLTGAATTGGLNNNFISLKTLTERLQYVRRLIREFWEFEVKLVQASMGFRQPATVRFDRMVLTDEVAEKALLIQLVDRDLISAKTIQERFQEDAMIEHARLRQESRMRGRKRLPPKAGPFHDAEQDFGLEKIALQTGAVTPSQVGLELDPNRDGQKTLIRQQSDETVRQQKLQNQAQNDQNDHQFRTEKLQLKHGVHPGQLAQPAPLGGGKGRPANVGPASRGQPGQGRPRNAKDAKKRKRREYRVRAKAEMMAALEWAENAFAAVSELTAKPFLKACKKANMRQLTTEEAARYEKFKLALLANAPYGDRVDGKVLASLLGNPLPVPKAVTDLLDLTVRSWRESEGREPPVEKVREFTTRIVALHKSELGGL